MNEEPKYSNCCYEADTGTSIDGPKYSELGICPDCKEHCDFLTAEEMENQYE
jgi:hypothetical protein